MCYMASQSSNVGVRELRQNLSVYLDRVKAGETLAVTEHNRVVATLRPAPPMTGLDRLVAEGRASAASRPFSSLRATPQIKLKKSLSRALDEERRDTI